MLSFGLMGSSSCEPEPFPQDFLSRNIMGFGQMNIRPTFASDPTSPSEEDDPWEEHLRGESSHTLARAQSSPMPAQWRPQPFTPAFPSEDLEGSTSHTFTTTAGLPQGLLEAPTASASYLPPSEVIPPRDLHGPGQEEAQGHRQQNVYVTGIPQVAGPRNSPRDSTEFSPRTPPYSIPYEGPSRPSADDRY